MVDSYDEVISLISYKKATDEIGDIVKSKVEREIFADFKSISQNEFYQAQAQGIKPELKFVIADYNDYRNEEELIYEGNKYKILRTYRSEDKLEITCYGGVNNGNA